MGEIEYESFSADGAVVRIEGVSVHPGTAKDKLVNALHLAAKLVDTLPQVTLTPETTDGRQGFIHATEMSGSAASATLHLILRDFEEEGLRAHGELLRQVCATIQATEPRAQIACTITPQYRNMRYWLEHDMRPVELAYIREQVAPLIARLPIDQQGKLRQRFGIEAPAAGAPAGDPAAARLAAGPVVGLVVPLGGKDRPLGERVLRGALWAAESLGGARPPSPLSGVDLRGVRSVRLVYDIFRSPSEGTGTVSVNGQEIGVMQDVSLASATTLATTLRPKLSGAALLHAATRNLPLDFFVLFSSAAAIVGGLGMAAYAAANAYLDALALARHAQNLPATSCNWGLWAHGALATADQRARFAATGMRPMATAPALEALARAITTHTPQHFIAALDRPRYHAVLTARGPRPLLSALAPRGPTTAPTATPTAPRTPLAAAPLGIGDLLSPASFFFHTGNKCTE